MSRRRYTTYRLTKSALEHTDSGLNKLFQWASTDHSGITEIPGQLPGMGFFTSLMYAIRHFLFTVLGAAVGGIAIYIMVAIGIPLLLAI